MPDGRVEFEITADGRKAFATIDDVTEALKKGGQQWERNAKESTDKIGGAFKDMFSALALKDILQQAGKALFDFGKEAIDAASDLSEVQNVVDATFGDNASVIENWAKNAAKQFGLTETRAKRFTSTMGAMMKSAGLSGDAIVEMSTDLSGLAADMSSFYNMDFDTAFQKIRAGISGETEPLKQLGINMSVANLNAYALKQGLEKTFDQMSQGEQIMLRYQYLMEATADAQGDFARTSDGFANATRVLGANIDILKTKLGTILLPVVNNVVSAINTMLEKLTQEPSRTVLDDFAAIDLKTAEKISAIDSTADKAMALTDVLAGIEKKIGNNKEAAGKMLDDVPDGSTGKLPTLKQSIEDLKSKLHDAGTEAGNVDKSIDSTQIDKYKGIIGEMQSAFTGAASEAKTVDGAIDPSDTSNAGKYKAELENLKNVFTSAAGEAKNVDGSVSPVRGSNLTKYKTETNNVRKALEKAATAAGGVDEKVMDAKITAYKGIIGEVKKEFENAGAQAKAVDGNIDPSDKSKAGQYKGVVDTIKDAFANAGTNAKAVDENVPNVSGSNLALYDAEAANTKDALEKIKAAGKTIDSEIPLPEKAKLTGYKGIATEAIAELQGVKDAGKNVDADVPESADTKLSEYKTLADGVQASLSNAGAAAKEVDNGLPEQQKGRIDGYKEAVEGVAAAAVTAGEEAAKIDDQVKIGEDSGLNEVKSAFEGIQTAAKEAASSAAEVSGSFPEAGAAAEEADEGTRLWLATCKELVDTIPGLSNIINTETGEIEGGTDAVYAYIGAWREAEKLTAMENAQAQKKKALDAKFADLPEYELNARIAERNAREKAKEIAAIYAKYGVTDFDMSQNSAFKWQTLGFGDEDYKAVEKLTKDYGDLAEKAATARAEQQKQQQAYDVAVESWDQGNQVLAETREQIDETAESMGMWSEATKAAAADAVIAFSEAAQAVAEYREKEREATLSQVKSTVKGFDKMTSATDAYKEAVKELDKEALEELNKDLKAGKITQEEYNKVITEGFNLPTVKSMISGLQDQAEYMKEFTQDMEDARKNGVSEELLASLADGTEESALYLHAVAEAARTGNKEDIDALNEAWKAAQEGKEKFADVLTEQKLAVDDTFQGMVNTAQEAAKGLDVSGIAKQSSENNVKAIAEGIAAQVPAVKDQVDAVIALLEKLSGWGINLDFTVGDLPEVVKPGAGGNPLNGTFETGLNYVPFDGFLASLHQGEGILTAEENRIWQQFREGGRGVDYDQLGGVMRDNIHAGGNVYLDGKTVGSVVSQMQGNSYRTLQRSGWQA